MLDCKTLPGFADANALLPDDHEVRLAITLLVAQAYAAGQEDGMRAGGEAALQGIRDAIGQPVSTHSGNTDQNT